MPTVKIVPFPGSIGPAGPQGPRGYQGETGLTGPMGPAGEGVGTQTWTATNDSLYEIHQVHGGVEVETNAASFASETITIVGGDHVNVTTITISVSPELDTIIGNIHNGSEYFRYLTIDLNAGTKSFAIAYNSGEGQWTLDSLDGNVTAFDGNTHSLNLAYGAPPVVWWNADDLGIMPEGEEWKFRGAKIEYHAYSTDSGTLIGTIYIAHDSGDSNVTHIETGSGGNDLGNVVLWKRNPSTYENERKLYVYRTDEESSITKIHWTAQVYYSPEYYD